MSESLTRLAVAQVSPAEQQGTTCGDEATSRGNGCSSPSPNGGLWSRFYSM